MSLRSLLRRRMLWVALALAAIAAVVFYLRARGPLVRTTLVRQTAIEQHIVASGRVRVPTRVQVAAQTGGLVVAVGAAEGQRVTSGALLVQLDDATARAEVAEAEARVKQAKARVDQLRRVGAIVANQTLREAETNLERAQTELARTEELVAKRAVAAVELENAQRAVAIARAQKTAADAQQAAATPSGAESRVALTSLLQAEAQLAAAQARLQQTRIVALHGGEVLTRSVEPGDVVQPSRTLLVLAADAGDELVFQADERNLAWIAVGQRAKASADAYPQQVFDAEVSYIAPSIDPQRGSVEVRLTVPAPPAFLKPDMTVSIDLTVAAKPSTLTVASEAVRGSATQSPHVFVVENSRVARRRAHRQPRHRVVRRGSRADAAVQPRAEDDVLDRHARSADRVGVQSRRRARRRPRP